MAEKQESHSLPSRVAGEPKACQASYVEGLKSELQDMVAAQRARNDALKAALGAGAAVEGCVGVNEQCGGVGHTGPKKCCGRTQCKWFNDWYSGCRAVEK